MDSGWREYENGDKENNDLYGMQDDCIIMEEETNSKAQKDKNDWKMVEYRMTKKRRLAKEREEAEADPEVSIVASTSSKLQTDSKIKIIEHSDDDDFEEVSLRIANKPQATIVTGTFKKDAKSSEIVQSKKQSPVIVNDNHLPILAKSMEPNATGERAVRMFGKSQIDSTKPLQATSEDTILVNANKINHKSRKAAQVDIMAQVPKHVKAIKRKRQNALQLSGLIKTINGETSDKVSSQRTKKSTKRKIKSPSSSDDESDYEIMKKSRDNEYPFDLPKSSDSISALHHDQKKRTGGDKSELQKKESDHLNLSYESIHPSVSKNNQSSADIEKNKLLARIELLEKLNAEKDVAVADLREEMKSIQNKHVEKKNKSRILLSYQKGIFFTQSQDNTLSLGEEWQWMKEDRDGKSTGDAFGTIKQGSPGQWIRYVPSDWPIKKHLFRVFKTKMESDIPRFILNFNENKDARDLIRIARKFQFKRLTIVKTNTPKWRLLFIKNNDQFQPGPFVSKKLSVGADEGLENFNRESKIGYLGPGTFPCNEVGCILCDLKGDRTTKTAILKVGNSTVEFTRRYTCKSKDIFYILTCALCEENGTWACHLGTTRSLTGQQSRINVHQTHVNKDSTRTFVNKTIKRILEKFGKKLKKEPILKVMADKVISKGSDPDQLFRDSHLHFKYFPLHTFHQMRCTVLQEYKDVDQSLVHAERDWKKFFKSDRIYDPKGNFSGPFGLNKTGWASAGE